MARAILITQCLQNDFVQPLKASDPLPNLLHVGHDEARRLMGEDPAEGPVARVMAWACAQRPEELALIHIRDWHDAGDSAQREHLAHFGPHCLAGSEGARFAFAEGDPGRPLAVIDSPGLSDFMGTRLAEVLSPLAAGPVRVGLVGVWTEAKITFLAYDLRTRYPRLEIAVCSALTASSSRAGHFLALEQLRRILGVKVFDSVGEFTRFLGGTALDVPLPISSHADCPAVAVEGADLEETDRKLVRYLFRDCRSVRLRPLGGGFSTTFQKRYRAGIPLAQVEGYLRTVFEEQLGRLYAAGTRERCNLLEYYRFAPSIASHVRAAVEKLLGAPADGPTLSLPGGVEVPNLCLFYEEHLARLLPLADRSAYLAFVHGDLNGANIVIDAHDNVWLIDFFHTHRGHVLRDLIKLENDLVFIFTPVPDEVALVEGFRVSDALLAVEDVTAPLPAADAAGLEHPAMARARETLRILRSFYPALVREDVDPLQVLIGKLRYAAHTLSFEESDGRQKLWALYTAARCAEGIRRRLAA